MLVSTRGRYALRVMIDLAENQGDGYIPLKEIAKRQEISFKYIEKIMSSLTKSGFVTGIQGKGGGYRMTKAADEYTVADILRVTEDGLSSVECLKANGIKCPRKEICRTLPMWTELNDIIEKFFSSKTIADLMRKNVI